MKLWSLIPLLRYQFGHPFSYNKSVGEACKINDWEHVAFVPTSCLIENLPENWFKVLGEDYFVAEDHSIIWKTPWQKLKTFIKTFRPLCRALKCIKEDSSKEKVIFVEQFFLPQFISLSIACLIVRPRAQLWFLHRYGRHQMIFGGKLYAFFHSFINYFIPVKLLTDSFALQEDQKNIFKQNIWVMPIPHTFPQRNASSSKRETLLWWPGGSTTEAKGLNEIKELIQIDCENVTFLVADSAQKYLKNSKITIQYIAGNLTRDEYIHWMHHVDCVLLPYDAKTYRFSTSGIFVEAIIAGAIPFTKDDTWMASELKRFDLKELILDWSSKSILEQILNIKNEKIIKSKLQKMQEHYKKFHSIEGFAKSIKEVYLSHVPDPNTL